MTDPLAPDRTTLAIREAEPALFYHLASGEVPSFMDLPVGQERGATGVGAALGPEDDVASTHCGFGDATARGVALDAFFAEVMGKASGIRRGRGGQAHDADLARGMLGADTIVGAGAPTALGCGRLDHLLSARPAAAIASPGEHGPDEVTIAVRAM